MRIGDGHQVTPVADPDRLPEVGVAILDVVDDIVEMTTSNASLKRQAPRCLVRGIPRRGVAAQSSIRCDGSTPETRQFVASVSAAA